MQEMSLDDDTWIQATERVCNIKTKKQENLLLFGSLTEINDAQLYLLQVSL
jgi:hypothetical protein